MNFHFKTALLRNIFETESSESFLENISCILLNPKVTLSLCMELYWIVKCIE